MPACAPRWFWNSRAPPAWAAWRAVRCSTSPPRAASQSKRALSETEIITLQAMKTGALIRFACRAGAILGQADAAARDNLDRYGVAIGQAFQIADDLLDVESDTATLGKAAGKDAAAGKGTLVSTLGIAGAHAKLDALIAEAEAALASFGRKADILRAAARFIAERRA